MRRTASAVRRPDAHTYRMSCSSSDHALACSRPIRPCPMMPIACGDTARRHLLVPCGHRPLQLALEDEVDDEHRDTVITTAANSAPKSTE